MKSLVFTALLALGAYSNTVSLESLIQQPSKLCKQNEIWTSAKGCIRSCTDPAFSSCADAFIAIWDPKFCALGSDGKWNSFTFECQACGKGSGYLGVANGQCTGNQVSERETPIKTPVVLDRCSVVRCMAGTTCYLGTCYTTGACATNGQCKSLQTCINGKCVQQVTIDRCSLIKCSSGFVCKLGVCIKDITTPINPCLKCLSTEVCSEGNCIDRCALVRCSSGYICKLGACIKNISVPVDPCSKCLSNETCSGGICINRCALVRCSSGYECKDGSCIAVTPIDKCALVKCRAGFECKDGSCVAISQICSIDTDCPISDICQDGTCFNLCITSRCSLGYTCEHGNCVPRAPEIEVCSADEKVNTKVCTLPRPDEQTCGTVYYIRAPDPLFCGVQANGSRINFARDCEACKDNSILYYFDQPCHKVPFVCSEGQKCNGEVCQSECQTRQDCPYDWQDCSNNKCVDPCIYMRCANCRYGQCGFQEPSGQCSFGVASGCENENWTCVGFECADLCLRTPCPPNHSCSNGSCIPNKN